MADNESDLEIDGLEIALESLCLKYCIDISNQNSKDYCSEFCELVEEYTGPWQVPLPQLKVLRTALCSFTKAIASFPDDCQHVQCVLSSLALSFFELMLFFSKEEFEEEPLKDIIDAFQECHSKLLRHKNMYLQHLKQIIKVGGPWENPVLQGILKEAELAPNEVEDFLSSELPIFLELRVRYLQACERMQEAMALSKSCLENHEKGKHLYFHQAYLTCLYKASLYENLHKEMEELDGRDAVEIICSTERVEKDELLLSLCKAFLTRQLRNGDMYYIWDLVFIWSRLHLRAHPSRQAFVTECLQLALSATNVRAIFPFIKLVTTELGSEGVQVGVELCARALQLCDAQADTETRSLVCKTIAFLLPYDLEICRACSLLVFCQERSLEAYRTVCLLYMHPDQEQHPHNHPLRTNIRFHILQMLKERLCFDPEFWNLLTLRNHCLELMSENVMKDAALIEMKHEVEKEYVENLPNDCVNESCGTCCHSYPHTKASADQKVKRFQKVEVKYGTREESHLKRKKWKKKLGQERTQPLSDDDLDVGEDPEYSISVKLNSLRNKSMYSLRRTNSHSNKENSASKFPSNRKREYLSRCVKSQILKRKGRKKRWLQGLPRQEHSQAVNEKILKVGGKKRGRKPLHRLEFSYPDNVIDLSEDLSTAQVTTCTANQELESPCLACKLQNEYDHTTEGRKRLDEHEKETSEVTSLVCENSLSEQCQKESQALMGIKLCGAHQSEPLVTAAEADPELDGPLLEMVECPVQEFHSYCLQERNTESEEIKSPESEGSNELNETAKEKLKPDVKTKEKKEKKVILTWREKLLRSQQYRHLTHTCKLCHKAYKGLNVMRHALSHLKNKKLKCILCGKRFHHLPVAKKHILEHIDQMAKDKPPDTEETANGIPENNNKHHKETPAADEASEQKQKRPTKVADLSREEQIIRNLRILVRKAAVLSKKSKNPDTDSFKQMEFKDEQVVIADDVVMIKNVSPVDGNEKDTGEKAAEGENSCGVDMTFPLCPSESCGRVFKRNNNTMIRHAVKYHLKEEKVREKMYMWTRHKCPFCFRKLQFPQHFIDHMKRHDNPLPFFCYHQECELRFTTSQELKEHSVIHKPFLFECTYPNCEKIFFGSQALFDHEWRHYIPAPQRDELELKHSKLKRLSEEAPWKQRVKIEEMWLQSKKTQKESSLDTGMTEDRTRNLDKSEPLSITVDPSTLEVEKPDVNGFDVLPKMPEVLDFASPSSTLALKPNRKTKPTKTDIVLDLIDVKDTEQNTTLTEVPKNIMEPHITEHKSFEPEQPTFTPFIKAPFVRPPPSTYLNEAVISMRKRRDVEEPPVKKCSSYSSKKKKEPVKEKEPVAEAAAVEQKVRHRCGKCLSSFGSPEELQSHEALNKCSSLFGFDSDDEC